MEEAVSNLTTALALKPREHLALVGGGGKTSLMFALAEELLQAKKRVVTSTTTKIWYHEAQSSPCVALIQSHGAWKDKLKGGLEIHGHVFLGQSLLDSGKVEGISPSIADELYGEVGIDYLLVEADGSAGRPVKAPADHEPVIPRTASKVVAMLGLEALGEQMGPDVVFRVDLFRKITGIGPGQRLTPYILSRLFLDPQGLFKGAPVSAKKMVFFNKLELLPDEREGKELAGLVLSNGLGKIDQVVIGSLKKGFYLISRGSNARHVP